MTTNDNIDLDITNSRPSTDLDAAIRLQSVPDHEHQSTTTGKVPGFIITQMCLVSVLCSFNTGLITIGLPQLCDDLYIDASRSTWPVLVYSLACGILLLLAGTLADILGDGLTNVVGVFFLGVFTISCGASKDFAQLLTFRALAGAALALFLPTSISIMSKSVPSGRLRNLGFSLIGVGQVCGYGFGLVVGGILVSSVGWRLGLYVDGGALLLLFATDLWLLRPNRVPKLRSSNQVDWIGIVLLSTSLGLLSYVLAQIASSVSMIRKAYIIVLLVLSTALLFGTVKWFGYQQKSGKPVLIPNSLWKNSAFRTICIMIVLAYAYMATMELLTSLYYQKIQGQTALGASIRLLPGLISALVFEMATGLLVHRLPIYPVVLGSTCISAAAPLLMAVTDPSWPYWWTEFAAQILYPLCADVLFTIALLIVSDTFNNEDQALAGAIFNTVGQFGQSFGLAIVGVISNLVTDSEVNSGSTTAVLKGYRAGFWATCAWAVLMCIIGAWGLRSTGRIGLKRD